MPPLIDLLRLRFQGLCSLKGKGKKKNILFSLTLSQKFLI